MHFAPGCCHHMGQLFPHSTATQRPWGPGGHRTGLLPSQVSPGRASGLWERTFPGDTGLLPKGPSLAPRPNCHQDICVPHWAVPCSQDSAGATSACLCLSSPSQSSWPGSVAACPGAAGAIWGVPPWASRMLHRVPSRVGKQAQEKPPAPHPGSLGQISLQVWTRPSTHSLTQSLIYSRYHSDQAITAEDSWGHSAGDPHTNSTPPTQGTQFGFPRRWCLSKNWRLNRP